MTLRGIIFDLGGTLLNYHPPGAHPQTGWQAMEDAGSDGLHAFLAGQGFAIPPVDQARAINFAVAERHWRRVGQMEPVNPQLGPILREVMAAWGVPAAALSDGLVDQAMAAYVAPVQAFVAPLEGARETLIAVRQKGLQTGLISNTVWPGRFHQQDLARWGLAEYLECTFFSADVAAWKPAPAIFQMALRALGLQPEEAAYVGDHPYFDVYGAQQAGLKGIWMWSGAWEKMPPADHPIVPDATLKRLPDLLAAIEPWLS